MVIARGSVWWADLGHPSGSSPGFERPVVVISSDEFNNSRIGTVVVAVITSNLKLAQSPGNVLLGADQGGLDRSSVVNLSSLVSIDRSEMRERLGELDRFSMQQVDEGLKRVLDL